MAKESTASPAVLGELAKFELMDNTNKGAKKGISKVPLTRLDCSFDTVNQRETLSIKEIVRQNYKVSRADITIMFAIRQPGCPSCREHGLDLSTYASKDPKLALIGAVKETGKNDLEILKFYQDYFRGNVLYLDPKWNIFKALGSRKITLGKVLLGFFRSTRRFRRKGVVAGTAVKGTENFITGGYLIFDRDGELAFALESKDFQEADISMIAAAVAETRRAYKLKKADSSTHTDTTVEMPVEMSATSVGSD